MLSRKVSDILVAPLILILFYTALMKIIDHDAFVSNLADSPWRLIATNRLWFSWVLPVFELVTTISLILPRLRLIGFGLSTLLFICFIAYLSYFIFSKSHLPCSCGGIIGYLNWPQHLMLNVIFLLISLWGIINERKLSHSNDGSNAKLNYTA